MSYIDNCADNYLVSSTSALNYFNIMAAKRIQNVHFIGIGGSGMSGIAEVLHTLGFKVTGSELIKNEATSRLSNLGVQIRYSHIPENTFYCDAVVVSSAVANDNIELEVAKQRRIPVIHRAEMLAELMRFKYGIAIAGTHGKTTTTSLIATILAEADLDPTFVVGGKLNKFSLSARLGSGNFFVSEADESDGSFLHLDPLLSVITNIDNDHLVNYNNDFNQLTKAFLNFIHKIPFYGLVILCRDDPVIAGILPQISRPMLTYGFSEQADLRVISYEQCYNVSKFKVMFPGGKISPEITLNLPGKHNVLNALAAIAVSMELKIEFEYIIKTLKNFHGVKRRFQMHGDLSLKHGAIFKQFLLIDDYGHHPAEIAAVIAAIRKGWLNKRLVMVFQPHRYSRTQQLWDEFIDVITKVDHLILLDLYGANEDPIDHICSANMAAQIMQHYQIPVTLISELKVDPGSTLIELLYNTLVDLIEDQDLLLMQGAGNIGRLTMELIEYCANNR